MGAAYTRPIGRCGGDVPVDAPSGPVGCAAVLDGEDDGDGGKVAAVGLVAREEEVDFDGGWVGDVCGCHSG